MLSRFISSHPATIPSDLKGSIRALLISQLGYKNLNSTFLLKVGDWNILSRVLREILTDKDGNLKNLGDNITNPQYANTLEKIRDEPESFYKGSLAEEIVEDIQRRGGIITLQDLQGYNVIRKKALVNQLGDMTWYTVPPPSSGPVITLILNILKGSF